MRADDVSGASHRKPMVLASHKLFLDLPTALEVSRQLGAALRALSDVDIVVCPSLINLAHVARAVEDSPLQVAAPVVHRESRGPYTGQVSLDELLTLHVRHVLIGHSETPDDCSERAERRTSNIRACLSHGVTPVLFYSDNDGALDAWLERLCCASHGITTTARPVIVYEPSAAIGAGETAGGRAANRTLDLARRRLASLLGRDSSHIRLLYGGGVNERNVGSLLRESDADGVVVGRASTDVTALLQIIGATREVCGVR